jgi:hypothetical protein
MASCAPRTRITCDWGLKRDGARLLFRNKGGRIVYESGGHAYQFTLELAVPGLFIYFPRVLLVLPKAERETILLGLSAWLAEVGYVAKRPLPVDVTEEEETCLISGCALRRIKGRYLCRWHFEMNISDETMRHFVDASSNNAV